MRYLLALSDTDLLCRHCISTFAACTLQQGKTSCGYGPAPQARARINIFSATHAKL